ncbi:hypothetical protein M33023_02350 [Candidatus Phytoplasma asteris]|uniref:Uncharacterized protein n=1 Tax=Candidatus Phytoplasma asteris TaxID=85620 RepID=A0ABZ2YHR7_9MOLU
MASKDYTYKMPSVLIIAWKNLLRERPTNIGHSILVNYSKSFIISKFSSIFFKKINQGFITISSVAI